MPIKSYFKGKGLSVMKKLKDEYGQKDGESAFYAISNKNKSLKPSKKSKFHKL